MTALKQYLLATTLLVSALSSSLAISYWLNQNTASDELSSLNNHTVKIQKMNKLNQSFTLLLPTIR